MKKSSRRRSGPMQRRIAPRLIWRRGTRPGLFAQTQRTTCYGMPHDVAAKRGEFIVCPGGNFLGMPPQQSRAGSKNQITQKGKNTETDPVPQSMVPHRKPTHGKLSRSSGARPAQALLLVVDGGETHDFEFLFSGRSGNLHLVADPAIEKRPADRGSSGYETFFDVGFFAADELVFNLDVALRVQNYDPGAVAGAVPGNVREI